MTIQTSPRAPVVQSGKHEVLVRRRPKVGRHADFLAAMRGFVSGALSPAPGGRVHTAIASVTDGAARRQFTATPDDAAGMTRGAEFTEGEVGFAEHSVLNAWVRPPALAASTAAPPEWKTATATFTGVLPVVTPLNFTLVRRPWRVVASAAVLSVVSRLLLAGLYPRPAAARVAAQAT